MTVRGRLIHLISFCALVSAVLSTSLGSGLPSTANASTTVSTFPLGTLTVLPDPVTVCPKGFSCIKFEVTCPNVAQAIDGYFAIAYPTVTNVGLVIFFSGKGGDSWFTSQNSSAPAWLADIRSNGLITAQVKWATPWYSASLGEDAGTAHLGCKPATLTKYVYDTYYAPLSLSPSTGQCGFCITGNSEGASQAAYPLAFYGVESILNAVIATGGPVHAAEARSCLRNSTERAYWYPTNGVKQAVDYGYGYFNSDGPCYLHDSTFSSRWLDESVATGGSDYTHPTTRVSFVFGDQDTTYATIGRDYENRLKNEGSPMVDETVAPSTGHELLTTSQGRDAWKAAILETPSPPAPTAWPLGTLTVLPNPVTVCPSGFSCFEFEVACPNVDQAIDGYFAIAYPTVTTVGMVIFFSGRGGDIWLTSQNSAMPPWMADLRSNGLITAEVRWLTPWYSSSLGNDAGTGHLGCRPATLTKYVYETYYAPLGLTPAIGHCGFCLAGNSGGASQATYPLAFYGLENILNAVIPAGGPVHATEAKSCLNVPRGYSYTDKTRRDVDEGYGYFNYDGPCYLHDPSFTDRWLAESTATGGNDYNHPSTRVSFVFGDDFSDYDNVTYNNIARDYEYRLTAEGSPMVDETVVCNTGHQVFGTVNGRDAWKARILDLPWSCPA